MNHEELRKMQNIQYEMLKAVNEICEKYHIQYYLLYGTLLGAVRHQGSIPWDYDIDIAMTRQELNKFLMVANELKEPLFLQNICYASIDYAGLTRVIWPNVEEYGNVHIDIFVLDYAKQRNEKKQKVIGAYCSLLHMAKLSESEKKILETHFAGNFYKEMVIKLSRVVEKVLGGAASIEKKIYRLVVCEHPTDRYIILEDIRKVLEKKDFDEVVKLQYENEKFPCPQGYKKLLTTWYGNYMQIPKEGIEYMKEENEDKM